MVLYQLMNKDEVVAIYEETRGIGEYVYGKIERFCEYLPYGFSSINDWIDSRQIARRLHPLNDLCGRWG